MLTVKPCPFRSRPFHFSSGLEALKLHPRKAGLNLATKAKQIPQLKDQATAATQVIAQKLGG
jgi:hypothetical protein